jgi:hypothetical protein
VDFISMLVSFVLVAFYVSKTLAVNDVMTKWRYDPKVYVDFYVAMTLDDVYNYLLAGLVFTLTIRLLQVLGYNKRMTMLANVLASAGRALAGYFGNIVHLLTRVWISFSRHSPNRRAVQCFHSPSQKITSQKYRKGQ